jgi:hypothetical protein
MSATATGTAERHKSHLKNTTAGVQPANPHHSEVDENFIIGYGPLAEYLTGQGFRTSKSTISKYCSPAINIGPPVEGFWGRLPAFKPSRAIEWAKMRIPAAVAGPSTIDDRRVRPCDRARQFRPTLAHAWSQSDSA